MPSSDVRSASEVLPRVLPHDWRPLALAEYRHRPSSHPSRVPLPTQFASLDPRHQRLLRTVGVPTRVPASGWLFRRGEASSDLYLLEQGAIECVDPLGIQRPCSPWSPKVCSSTRSRSSTIRHGGSMHELRSRGAPQVARPRPAGTAPSTSSSAWRSTRCSTSGRHLNPSGFLWWRTGLCRDPRQCADHVRALQVAVRRT